jgi:sn-1 stearoyl-lipid 9-desaturase
MLVGKGVKAPARNHFKDNMIVKGKLNTPTVIAMALFHVGAVIALFMFSWKALFVALFLYWVAGSLGIGLAYHRLLTHRGFKCPKWFEYFLTVCATLALEGGPIFWVGVHRLHHQITDKPGDPHSPRDGGFWAHMGWIMSGESLHNANSDRLLPYVPDLRKDKFHLWISKYHYVPMIVLGIGLWAFGGLAVMMWGIFFRTVFLLHSTWFVNSATHMWGSKRFATDDDSRNLWWVAYLSFGEGWHNNHHAHPQSARHGLAWYEFDLNWYAIKAFSWLGLISDVKLPKLRSARVQPVETDNVREQALAAAYSGD